VNNKIILFSLFFCFFTKTVDVIVKEAVEEALNNIKKESNNIKNAPKKNPSNINSYNTFGPLSPTFNNTPTFDCHPTFNNYNLLYLMTIGIKDSIVGLKNQIGDGIEKLRSQEVQYNIKKILWEKKFKITFYLLVCSYSALASLLIYDYQYIKNDLLWARWKSEYSFEQLCGISSQQLAKELMLTIQHSNINRDNPTDFVQPMTNFMNKIDEEVRRIERYLTVARMVKKMHLVTIFPVNEQKIESAQKLLAHAHFVKHIFLSWLAENNCINNNLVKSFQVCRAVRALKDL